MEFLLSDKRIDINRVKNTSETPFCTACCDGRLDLVKLLLNDERLEVNKGEKIHGFTPLHYASQSSHFEMVRYILAMRRDVDLNVKNNAGKTAIDLTRERENLKIAEYWEDEVEFQERKRRCAKIIELLESFERNPNETNTNLRIQLGIAGKSFFFFSFFSISNPFF